MEEEVWFDVLDRRPYDYRVHVRAMRRVLPYTTQVHTATYPGAGVAGDGDGYNITLVLKGFSSRSEQAEISTGLFLSEASESLCRHIVTDEDMARHSRSLRLLELGSGLGKCGLLAHRLITSRRNIGRKSSTVLTDGDTNVLCVLRDNVCLNADVTKDHTISCGQLRWGEGRGTTFLQKHGHSRFNIILGCDLFYTDNMNVDRLFQTVDELLDDTRVGKFILAHNETHMIPVKTVLWAAKDHGLFYEVLNQEGAIHLLCFRRSRPLAVHDVVARLQNQIKELEEENRLLKTNQVIVERKCKKLEERCTFLRNERERGLPESILLALNEDDVAGIASFLEPRDVARLASTCRFFGWRTHRAGDANINLMQMVVYKILEDSTPGEKESLGGYANRNSPYTSYGELIELRRPLRFDLLFGCGIKHAPADKSILIPKYVPGYIKLKPHPGRSMFAYTAASNYVMRGGRHYVKFTCDGRTDHGTLWFGLVRPLNGLTRKDDVFTPFCSRHVDELSELRVSDWGGCNIHCCVYTANRGKRQSTSFGLSNEGDFESGTDLDDSDLEAEDYFPREDWEGMQSFHGGEIGLLLDYDKGTLTVYKNGIKLGVMFGGLSGAYSWMVAVGTWFSGPSTASYQIKIERGQPPEEGDNDHASLKNRTQPRKSSAALPPL